MLAGRAEEARRLLAALERFANEGKMLPEQVWDSDDVPEFELSFGRPTGSAMPLAWAHAEYLKLIVGRRPRVRPAAPDAPALVLDRVEPKHVIWRPNHRRGSLPPGKVLRVLLEEPATISFQCGDGPRRRIETQETGLGIYYADLPTAELPADEAVRFCFDRPKVKWLSHRDWYVIRCGDVTVQPQEQTAVETSR